VPDDLLQVRIFPQSNQPATISQAYHAVLMSGSNLQQRFMSAQKP
jgi:hypothetical protein